MLSGSARGITSKLLWLCTCPISYTAYVWISISASSFFFFSSRSSWFWRSVLVALTHAAPPFFCIFYFFFFAFSFSFSFCLLFAFAVFRCFLAFRASLFFFLASLSDPLPVPPVVYPQLALVPPLVYPPSSSASSSDEVSSLQ